MYQQNFVIVDPVMPSNNTARNSFRTNEILDCFRNAFKSLKNFVMKQYLDDQEILKQKTPMSQPDQALVAEEVESLPAWETAVTRGAN